MFTQETQSGASEASQTEPRRSKKPVAIIAFMALIILAAIGVYFVGFRSLPTTVSWATSVSAIAPGGNLTVKGQVTPADGGRDILVQSAPTAKGPWQQMLPTTTDNQGRFVATFKPPLTGSIVMRVVVGPGGRYVQVIGLSRPVRLLALSTLSLKGIGTPTNRTPVSFAATVNPPSPGRTVRIEQSRDNRHWAPVGLPAKTNADSISVVKVSGLAIGQWSYRATVGQDDSFAAAHSPAVGAKVEDYKVVEARVAAEKAKAHAAADAAAEAAKKAASTAPNKPNCPDNQGPIAGNWCLHSANGPDNPGYVQQCEIPGVPKYQWPAAVDGKCA